MKRIFQKPFCFSRTAESSHCWFTGPEASVILPADLVRMAAKLRPAPATMIAA